MSTEGTPDPRIAALQSELEAVKRREMRRDAEEGKIYASSESFRGLRHRSEREARRGTFGRDVQD